MTRTACEAMPRVRYRLTIDYLVEPFLSESDPELHRISILG